MKISIVTPSFNNVLYLRETIQNIQIQTYQNFEHIIVDGASNDGTIELLQQYPHLRWISERDQGQSDALNKGFKLASGEVLAWQNADDLYFPETFQIVTDFFQRHPQVDIVYGDYQLIGPTGEQLSDVHPINWNQWLFTHGRFVPIQPTVFWRRRVYQVVGGLDESLHYCMDVDFFARALKKQFIFARIPTLLGKFRIHPESKTGNVNNRHKVYVEYKGVLSKHFEYTPLDNLLFNLFYLRGRVGRRFKLFTFR